MSDDEPYVPDQLDLIIVEAFRGTTKSQRDRFFETGDPIELEMPDEIPLDELPELSDEDREAIDRRLGPDFIERLLRENPR